MSFELELWSVERPDLLAFAQGKAKWSVENAAAVHAGRGWQLIAERPDAVDFEDVPDEVSAALPGAQFRTQLSLEPIGAPESAYKLLQRVTKDLAKQSHGAIYNPQDDSVTLPSGVKKIASCGKRDTVSTVMMSWWFGPDVLDTPEQARAFIQLLKRLLPEALPKRYGTYEPPEFKSAEHDEEHLAQFFAKHADDGIFYPHRPVLGFSLDKPGVSETWPPDDRNFRANQLVIEVDRDVLQQPGWERQVRYFWERMSMFLKPVYGDVRTIRGYDYHAGALYHGSGTEGHPCWGKVWFGVPQSGSVTAAMLGTRYQEAWPQFSGQAELKNGLAFLSLDSWLDEKGLFEGLDVPERIADPAPRKVAEPLLSSASVVIKRPVNEVYAMLDWESPKNLHRQKGDEIIGTGPTSFQLISKDHPQHRFDVTVTQAEPDRSYAFETRITPALSRMLRSQEVYRIEAVDDGSSRLTLELLATFDPRLTTPQLQFIRTDIKFAAENALEALRFQADGMEEGLLNYMRSIGVEPAVSPRA